MTCIEISLTEDTMSSKAAYKVHKIRSFPIKERTITVTFRLFREQVLQGHDTYEITAVFIVSQPVCSD